MLPLLAVNQDKASALANNRRTRVPRRPVSATKSTGRSNTSNSVLFRRSPPSICCDLSSSFLSPLPLTSPVPLPFGPPLQILLFQSVLTSRIGSAYRSCFSVSTSCLGAPPFFCSSLYGQLTPFAILLTKCCCHKAREAIGTAQVTLCSSARKGFVW